MFGRIRVVVLAGLFCAGAASADETAANAQREERRKAAWEWTMEERLARRFDPDDLAERMAYRREKNRRIKALSGMAGESSDEAPVAKGKVRHDDVDGSRNPELYLPHELFDALMTVFSTNPEIRMPQRELFSRSGLQHLGFDPARFWSELESLSGAYIQLRYHSQGGAGEQLCRARYEALEAARRHYGRERFEKMLYVAIAPLASSTAGMVGADPAERLRREAEGCR